MVTYIYNALRSSLAV